MNTEQTTEARLLEAIEQARQDVREARRVLARGIFTLEVLVEQAGAKLDKADLRIPKPTGTAGETAQ